MEEERDFLVCSNAFKLGKCLPLGQNIAKFEVAYMENKIPIPTDNIFKFYALFGLLLFVFSASSIIYVTHSTNELAFQAMVQVETLKQIPNPTPVDSAKMQVLEKRLEIAVADKKFYLRAIEVIAAFSVISMIYGFRKWHKEVQPIQDEIARLQLEKLRHEIKVLKHEPPSDEKIPPKLASPKISA